MDGFVTSVETSLILQQVRIDSLWCKRFLSFTNLLEKEDRSFEIISQMFQPFSQDSIPSTLDGLKLALKTPLLSAIPMKRALPSSLPTYVRITKQRI